MRWLGNSDIIRQIRAADVSSASVPSWTLGAPAGLPLRIGSEVFVARYRSLAQFQADVTNGAINSTYSWVLYDPENWDDTPAGEQADPWTWLPRFGQYAHARGYRVITAPARDLGNVANTAFRKQLGEDLTDWFMRTTVAYDAGLMADIFSVQSQALTEDVLAYQHFVTNSTQQAKHANPYVKVFAGVSTNYGSAAQMAAAARSVHVDGYWLNVPGPDPDIAKAVAFLHLMTGGT